jgi:hypothetical protein
MSEDPLATIKADNLTAARLAAAASPLVLERLVNMAQLSDDPEEVRKISETLLKWSTLHTEKKDNVVYQPAIVTFDFSNGVMEVKSQPATPAQIVEMVQEVEDVPDEPLALPEPANPTFTLDLGHMPLDLERLLAMDD